MATSIFYEVHPVSYEIRRPNNIPLVKADESIRISIRDEQCTTLCKNRDVKTLCCSNGGQLTDGDICDKEPTIDLTKASNSCWIGWHLSKLVLTMSFTFGGPQRIRSITIHTLFQRIFQSIFYPFHTVTMEFRNNGKSVSKNASFVWNDTTTDRMNTSLSLLIDVGDLWAEVVTLNLTMTNYNKKLALSEVAFIGVTELTTSPSQRTVCTGCDAFFQCNVTDPSLFVRWYRNVTLQSKTFRLPFNSPSTISSLLSLRNVKESDSGVYVCEVYNSSVSLSSSVNLVVLSVQSPTSSSGATSRDTPSTSSIFSDPGSTTHSTYWYETKLFTWLIYGGGGLLIGLLIFFITCCLYCRHRRGEIPIGGKHGENEVELQTYTHKIERVETIPIEYNYNPRNSKGSDKGEYQNCGVLNPRAGDGSTLYVVTNIRDSTAEQN